MTTDNIVAYLGFDTPDANAEAVEVWLGDNFYCHLPSKNLIMFYSWPMSLVQSDTQIATVGQVLVRLNTAEVVAFTPNDYQRWLAL